jgi:hypothetical protein
MALGIDGTNHASVNPGTSLNATITTTLPNDIICVCCQTNGGPLTGVSSTALGAFTFGGRGGGAPFYQEFWYAVSSGTLSADTVTVNATSNAYIVFDVFAISGANTSTPLDGSVVTGSTAPLSITTTNANDIIVGSFRMSTGSDAVGAGFTIISAASNLDYILTEYQIVSATQTGLSVGINTNANSNGAVAFAIQQAAAAAPAAAGTLPLMGVG